MPLLDHFHSSWKAEWPSEGVHSAWATDIAYLLNKDLLPEDYHAIPLVTVGGRVEVDVATLRSEGVTESGSGGVATAIWAPPQPSKTLAVDFLEREAVEVQVIQRLGGAHLRAAVELLSPANKDRPRNRRHFALKCASYLEDGVSVVLIDVVTERLANLHAELLQALEATAEPAWQSPTNLYAVSYRRVLNEGRHYLEIWHEPLTLGSPLPTMPLWLDVDLCVPLRLEESYQATCEKLRIPLSDR
jgi:hypothetical protein